MENSDWIVVVPYWYVMHSFFSWYICKHKAFDITQPMFPLLVAFTVSDLEFSFKVDVQHLVLNLMNIIHFTGQLGLMKFCCFQEDMFKDYQISRKRSRKVNLISRYFILDRLCRLCFKVTKDHIQIVFFLLAEKGCWSHPKGFCIDIGLHIFFWNSEKF